MSVVSAPEIERYFSALDQAMSRTVRTRRVDASVSSNKRPPLLSGDALIHAIDRNRRRVAEFVAWRAAAPPRSSDELFAALITIGGLTSTEILPEGLLRVWEYNARAHVDETEVLDCPPTEILTRLRELCAAWFSQLQSTESALGVIAEMEWELVVGPIHPFYDGAGRISRYFSALMCMWCEVVPRIHLDRTQYFDAARTGTQAFCAYYFSAPPYAGFRPTDVTLNR